MAADFSISSTVHQPMDAGDFLRIKRAVLGNKYSLSLVFIGDKRSRHLARVHRGKDAPANVLSFPLSTKEGEIFLNLAKVRREATRFGLTPHGHARFLFIHGCLHLAGMKHGGTMERAEDALMHRFKLR